jgi:hypothetical protein
MVAKARCSPQVFPAPEAAVGEVIAFGLPRLRTRRKPTNGYCEVTILPARIGDDRDVHTSSRAPKWRRLRKPGGLPRPVGAGLK